LRFLSRARSNIPNAVAIVASTGCSSSRPSRVALLAIAAAASAGCSHTGGDVTVGAGDASTGGGGRDAPVGPALDSDDPALCLGCHAEHHEAWSLSMHAYAGDDPIFRAMNARGQRETGGALGDFCVRCHAPVALARGATTDGLNLGDLAAELRGGTCVVCHTGAIAAGAGLDLADDGLMRGPIVDPIPNPVHGSVYSPFLDRDQAPSASFCGACHGVTNGHGVAIERTIDEWRTTSYAQTATLRACGRCHMPETIAAAADVAGAPLRPVHGHSMPGVDLGGDSPAQAKLVAQTLDPAISSRLCVVPGGADGGGNQVSVTLENALIGHDWPSGATHDRRAWVEIVAYAQGAVVYASGLVGDGEAVGASASPPLLVLREQLYDDQGRPTLFMWNAASTQSLLLAPATGDPANATQTATVAVDAAVDRVTARVRIRAVDYDVTEALVASGDLAPDAGAPLPTLTVAATVLEWTADRGAACLP
jgi:Cytochrome c554 and c-prime